MIYFKLQILVWKSNFDKEVLAKSLLDETNVDIKTNSTITEENVRNIDGKQSFHMMEQPDVEVC